MSSGIMYLVILSNDSDLLIYLINIMQNYKYTNTRHTHSKCLILLYCIAAVFVFSPASALAAKKKKPTGDSISCTGFYGVYQPKWPHVSVEIKVTSIEEGSPSSSTGLKPGDVVVGIGNKIFQERPRWAMAKAIDDAEAKDGKLALLLKSGKKITIPLAKLGGYSPTAPYNCAKTDKIIKQAADALMNADFGSTPTRTGLLGLMATGEKRHLNAVAKYIHESDILKIDPKKVDIYLNGGKNEFGPSGWTWGYNLIALGEYYLLTKDEKVLPAMKTYALGLARGQDGVGCWGHKMATKSLNGRAPGYGTMNQSTISSFLGLILAQRCGIKDPILDKAIERTYATIENVVGRGAFSYGSGGVYSGFFNNNGTSGSAAICMSLKGNQEGTSYFSQAAATTYDRLTSGHASSFFNPLWTPSGASLSGPEVTQKFFRKSLWYFNGRRHWKDGFPGSGRGGMFAGQALLMYCLPRKALLITGREADESIYLKGPAAAKVIMRSKIDYKNKSIDELLKLSNDDFIQVREKAVNVLSSKLRKIYKSKKKIPDLITPKLLDIIKNGNEQERVNGLYLIGKSPQQVITPQLKQLVGIIRNKEETFEVRVAAVSAIGEGNCREAALPYYDEILQFTLEERPKADPFGNVDAKISKSLAGMFRYVKAPESQKVHAPDKVILFKVASKFLTHKRQTSRKYGMKMLEGITMEEFPIVAEQLMHVLEDKDPTYHTYSSVISVEGINILADLNIKEGLDILENAIFHGGGKWAFKYKGLMKTLPKYGANAIPYIPKYEAHRSINKPGDRFTPSWQKMVEKIKADKNPKKLMTIEEVMRAAKKAKKK